ncbi:hypothetical protein C8R44DRAFT_789738 [Mycena epipterygia]|nr:hypothetical protein C8R44DRAFT_789738 [Mycena epipterygia]
MTISQVRAQIEDALRDKNKGLRVPQNILDLEYKYNKEFRELNAQVRDKTGMGAKRKREADPVAPKASKSKSADVAAPAPKRAATAKTKAEPTPDVVPAKKPRIKQADEEAPIPRTKQTAKKTVKPAEDSQMEVDVKPVPKPRTKQTAKKTVWPAEDFQMDVDVKPIPKPRTKQTVKKTAQLADDFPTDVDVKPRIEEQPKPRTKQTARKTVQPEDDLRMDADVKPKPRTKQTARKTVQLEDDLEEPHAPRTKTTAKRSVPPPVASSSSIPDPPPRAKQTARRGRPFPSPPARSTAPRLDSVSGVWAIECSAISDEWDYMGSFTLNIVGRGATLEGEFELGIIRGLLRCDRVEQRGPNGAYAAVHWAGQENEGPVCPPNARQSGYIKFTGDKLKGKLNNVPACGDVDFEGKWLGGAGPIMAGWDDYNEDAYERANRNRWH